MLRSLPPKKLVLVKFFGSVLKASEGLGQIANADVDTCAYLVDVVIKL